MIWESSYITHEDLIKRVIFRSAKYVINHASLVNSVACIEMIILLITVQQSNGHMDWCPSTRHAEFVCVTSISFPEHARSRVSGGHSSGETNFSRTISYGWRMLLDDYHQIAIHIKCGPTRALIMFHRNLLKLYTPARLRKLGKFSPRAYIYLILFRWND